MIEVTPSRFYILGMVCFSVIAIMTAANFVFYFNDTNIFAKISTAFYIFFYVGLVFFFNYLLSLEPKITETKATDDIEQLIKDLKKKNVKKKK